MPDEAIRQARADDIVARNVAALVKTSDGREGRPSKALAAGSLGLAVCSGTDVVICAASLILLRDDLGVVPDAIRLARATFRTIRRNLAWAFGYNIAGSRGRRGVPEPADRPRGDGRVVGVRGGQQPAAAEIRNTGTSARCQTVRDVQARRGSRGSCPAQLAGHRLIVCRAARYRDRVLGPDGTVVVALAAAFAIAVLATPAGISGAVLLLPFQVSVLGTPSPAVTPTNLLYNVVATPGALYRYWRQGQSGGRLALVLIAGTLPGVIAGSVIRVELLPGAPVFDVIVGAVLLPLGAWLALTRAARPGENAGPARAVPATPLILLAAVVGCVGGIYGIGGGSILAPILVGTGRSPREVAPAALASTFVTSAAGVVTFLILSVHHRGAVAPDWPTGIALGLGGLAGAYAGARIQGRLPDVLIRRVMGVLVVAIGARYLWLGLS